MVDFSSSLNSEAIVFGFFCKFYARDWLSFSHHLWWIFPYRETLIRIGKVELIFQWQTIPFSRMHIQCIFLQRLPGVWTKEFHYPWTALSWRHNLLVRISLLLQQSHVILEGFQSQFLTQILPLLVRQWPMNTGEDDLVLVFVYWIRLLMNKIRIFVCQH